MLKSYFLIITKQNTQTAGFFRLSRIKDNGNGTFETVGRKIWNATNPTQVYKPLKHPTNYVIIIHTAGRLCKSIEECSFVLRYIQKLHKDRGFGDIGYNFLIGGDGRVYVGRGWDEQGRHTIPFNNKSIGIAFSGTFTTILPPKKALKACKLLLENGVAMQKLSPNYTLYSQKQVINTESPGLKLIEEIKSWSHWNTYDPLEENPTYTSPISPLV